MSYFNEIIPREDQDEIDACIHAIVYRLVVGRVVCLELPKIFDQRFKEV